ncbi:unnamed protein product [Cladocopium goreaui]|uniref:Uncharacterized protein n=1 Tax=Cladocopium goreaui TaxID=2562237 RepID=A0A9P1FRD4_9DINO|nr:unnamed protein product [Cladocopium goreaui]
MSYVDSQSVFKARCDEIKITAATYDELQRKGWSTFGSYAFSVTTNPGQLTDDDFDTKVAVPILGSSNAPEAALLRRLLFESYTLTATELKRKADNTESDAPKKLPIQEIAARFTAIEKKLQPLKIESVMNAMRRRGIAYELANLMSFEKRELIVNMLFAELQREPMDGFRKLSMAQLAAADREIHLKLSEKTRAGLPLGPAGELPLDVHVQAVLEMPAIMWLLMQKPKTNAAVDKTPAPSNPQPKPKNKPWSPPKSGKFDKKNRRLSKTPMPAQLRGGTPVDSDGKSICYGYNLGSCHDKQCKRGRHVCCRPGCQTRVETSEAEKPASVPTSAKAVPGIFPSVDIIQDEPVSNVEVEGLATPFTRQRMSADTSFGGEPPLACKGPAVEGAKAPPFLLELFCGTARVCAQFRTQGGRALGVDHHLKRAKLKAAAVQLDLTQQWVQDLIVKEITLGRISGIHLGPPCGTASKARNIPIKRKLVKKGAPNPQPLRSSAYPLGFPWLKGLNKVKVQAANCLYEFSANLVLLCEKHDVLFTVENPENSLMWETPFFKPLLQRFYFHVIDACEYGSEHKKSTAFLANFDAPRLKQRCSGDHSHAAWKVRQLESGDWAFDTAKAAEYPSKLAHELAASFLEELAKRGDIHLQDELVDHAVKISAESQPRRTKGPLLLSEFKSKVAIECVEDDNPPLSIPEDAKPPWQGIPVGAKRLDLQPVIDEKGGSGRLKAIYGVYFSPQEFVQRVQQLTHPFDVPLPLDESNMESIAFILERGPAGVAKHRADMLQHYIGRARALQQDEARLHETLNESIQPVMATKWCFFWAYSSRVAYDEVQGLGRAMLGSEACLQAIGAESCDAWASILAVANPADNNVYYFEAIALPFGSVSSVIGFNRAARALRMILTRLFKLVVTNFFDDFCQIELAPLSDGAWKTAELVLSLLGWRISMGDDKRKAFSKRFEILGAIVTFPPPECNHRSYEQGHTYGRTTQLACQLLHKFGGQGPSVTVTPELVHVVSEALSLLMEAKPRLVQSWSEAPPLLLFTDGAVEDSLQSVTHGAVLVELVQQSAIKKQSIRQSVPDYSMALKALENSWKLVELIERGS